MKHLLLFTVLAATAVCAHAQKMLQAAEVPNPLVTAYMNEPGEYRARVDVKCLQTIHTWHILVKENDVIMTISTRLHSILTIIHTKRKIHVKQNNVNRLLFQCGQNAFRLCEGQYAVKHTIQTYFQRCEYGRIVIHNKYCSVVCHIFLNLLSNR